MIDRFLRNNLGDDDYAEYSAALEAIASPQAALAEPSEPKPYCCYCESDNEGIRSTYFDQTCEGCVKRMTHPAKPEPLTDEAISKMYIEHSAYQEEGPETSGWYDFARAVEAAILEKLK